MPHTDFLSNRFVLSALRNITTMVQYTPVKKNHTDEVKAMLQSMDYEYWRDRLITPIIVLIGVLGNLLVILVFARKRRLHQAPISLVLFVSVVAVADSLILLLTLWSFSISLISDMLWPSLYNVYFVLYVCNNLSILASTLVVIDRWLAVTRPLKHNTCGNKYVAVTCCTCAAVIALVTALPSLWSEEVNPKYPVVLYLVMYFLLPCGTVSILNSIVCHTIWETRKRQQKECGYDSTSLPCALREDYSITMMLTVEAILFLFYNTLYAVLKFIFLTCEEEGETIDKSDTYLLLHPNTKMILRHCADILTLLDASTNFMVFFICGSQFRFHLRAMWTHMTTQYAITNSQSGSRRSYNTYEA